MTEILSPSPQTPASSQDAPSVRASARAPIDEMTFNTAPNYLTLLRIAFVPLIVVLMYQRTVFCDALATAVFVIASITDYFDGYLARTRQLITVYGKLLDPLADKFLVVAAVIMLQELGRIHAVVVMLLVCRELAITGLRALASAEGVIISASAGGKWKTATQMTAIPMLICNYDLFGVPFIAIGQGLLLLSLGLSLWSAKDYAVAFFKALHQANLQKKLARKAKKIAKKQSGGAGKVGKILRNKRLDP